MVPCRRSIPVTHHWLAGTAGLARAEPPLIAGEDQITYSEAQAIVGYSKVHLWRLVRDGELSREGSGRAGDRDVRLSRAEVEALALRRYRRGRKTDYWMTPAEAAEALGSTRQAVYALGLTRKAANGDLLLTWEDVARAALNRQRKGREAPLTYPYTSWSFLHLRLG